MGTIDRPVLEVWLLGRFEVTVAGQTVAPEMWRSRRSGDVLKLLALAPGHRLPRDVLVERLWPGREPTAGTNSLHQALFTLRRALDSAGGSGADLVTLRDDVIGLGSAAGTQVWTDVEAFTELAARARATGDVADLRAAAAAFTGSLLPDDPYEDWAVRLRETLASTRVRVLVALAEQLVAVSAWVEAERALDDVLAVDRSHEQAHRLLMRVLAETGRRQQALRQFELLRGALADELGVDPDPESMRLHARLLRDEGIAALSPASAPLPETLTSFVGREREIAEVERLLESSRLVILTGAGGTGKTRLALETARRNRGRFAPVAFVQLDALAEERAVDGAAAVALGIREHPGAPLREDIAACIGFSAGLMVLDNCEHLIGAAAALADHLLAHCPRLRILATSREPLRAAGEVVWVVPSMGLPDPKRPHEVASARAFGAVRLFEERARAAAPRFELRPDNVDATVRLCHRLDGLPLALELAAARAPALSPGEMLERLEAGFDVLATGSRTALNRQQTLRGTLDWSAALLSDTERALFRRLGVFAGVFDLPACETVCAAGDVDRTSVAALLAGLVDKSLVVAEPGVTGTLFHLLVTIRDYARDALTRSGEGAALRAAHAAWCEAIATAGDARAGAALRWRDDLRLGFAWLLQAAPERALALAATVAEAWVFEGHNAEIHEWLTSGLHAVRARSPARAAALLELCNARYASAPDCAALAQESYSIANEHGDQAAALRAAHAAGAWYWVGDDAAGARVMLNRSLQLAAAAGDAAARAAVLNSQAVVAWEQGRLERAAALLDEALAAAVSAPATGARVLVVNGSARVVFRAFDGWGWPGMTETAVPLLGTPVRALPAMLAANAGSLCWTAGHLEAAGRRLHAARSELADLGDLRGTALIDGRLALVASDRGDVAQARALAQSGLGTFRQLGEARATMMLLGLLAEVEQAAGDTEAAWRWAEESESLARRHQDRPALMSAQMRLGHIAAAGGKMAQARGHLRDALDTINEIRQGPGFLRAWLQARLGSLAAIQGGQEEARARLEAALSWFVSAGRPDGAAFCRHVLAGDGVHPVSPA